jgi:hypothetical protein
MAPRREIADQAQLQNELQGSARRPRRGFTSRGRLAAALAVAAVSASGAAIVTGVGHSQVTAPQRSSGQTSMPGLHTGATSASFARRIRKLESAGYVEAACRVDGDLMFNPHTGRYRLVRA